MMNLFARLACAAAGLVCLAVPAAAQQAAPAQKPWWERITFGGDFRGRYEGFLQDDREARHRGRFRLRLAINTRIHDEVNFGIRFASGDPNDITSTNQSLTDFWARKPITVDQAFLVYTPRAARALTLGGGRFPYPVARTQMLWDDDVNWEGAYEQLSKTVNDRTSFRFVAVQGALNDVSADDDAFMIAWYGQASHKMGAHTMQLSVADYKFHQVDQIAVAVDTRGLRNPITNLPTRNAAGRVSGFLSDFNLVDVIAQGTFVTKKADYPVTLLLDWVTNTQAANGDDTGIWFVAGYGRAARPRTWALTHTIARIEREAVLSTFNFSDIPHTNTWMNMTTVSCMPVNRLNLDFTAILTKPIRRAGNATDNLLKRIQGDVRVTF